SFQFYPTLAKNLYFAVPITFDMAYTFATGKWRFPMGIGIGGIFQSYSGNAAKYFGMLFRPEAGVYYQYSPEWSFGGGMCWSIVPQWYRNTTHNRVGNILTINFAARYHF
ncbi:TP0733 family outer membrane beta-barrel protein, partial [Treponema pedis]|uniref:TP0733 family outer membrane beta-barrel protein n=1 Tax=Treponema pedis TaxID=409322 RepID=UPI0031410E67